MIGRTRSDYSLSTHKVNPRSYTIIITYERATRTKQAQCGKLDSEEKSLAFASKKFRT